MILILRFLPTGPTASIDLADPTSVNEGANLAVCVQLDMPPSSDATAFISTQDRPTQTAIGEFKLKPCLYTGSCAWHFKILSFQDRVWPAHN